MGSFVGDAPVARSRSMFFGGNSRIGPLRRAAERRAAKAGTTPFLRQSVASNLSPRGFGRLNSLTSLTGQKSLGFYTPFQGMSGFADLAMKNRRVAAKAAEKGITAREGAVYSGGVLGRMMTISNLFDIESTIAKAGGIDAVRGGAGGAKAARALSQRTSIVQNIGRVQNLANPGAVIDAARIAPRGPLGATTSAERLAASRAAMASSIADDPMKAVASTMTRGELSNRLTGYFAGAINPALMSEAQGAMVRSVITKIAGSEGAAASAISTFMDDFGKTGKYAGSITSRLRRNWKTSQHDRRVSWCRRFKNGCSKVCWQSRCSRFRCNSKTIKCFGNRSVNL